MKPILLAFLMVYFAGAARDVGAAAEAPIPPDFGVRRQGKLERIVYSESAGERYNPVHKEAIEAQCATARALGLTDAHPSFEPGHDRPLKTESWRFSNERRWALFTALHVYECDGSSTSDTSSGRLCGCTYRIQIRRTYELKNRPDGGVAHEDPAKVRQLAPEVIGRDVVAGIPCVIRRQRLGAEGWIDRCITDDPSEELPPPLRDRTLAEVTQHRDREAPHSWSRTVKVVQDALVDIGIFDPRNGATTRGEAP
ncbi:MAG TPA: hypothetical protein VGP22_07285 [Albitalea sp.]|jgi:hypothetical protein|nr:hypothetical protein [Albitalea sp.]